MRSPYYDSPELCALLCLLFTALVFGLGLACWRGLRVRFPAETPWWNRTSTCTVQLLVGAFAALPTALFLQRKFARICTPLLLCAGASLTVLALWRLRNGRAALLTAVGTLFTATWAGLAPDNSIEALFTFWMVLGVACFGGPVALEPAEPPALRIPKHVWFRSDHVHDAFIAIVGGAVAYASARWVTEGFVGSADEWANEYQAALFAKGKLYGSKWPCFDALRMYYVYWQDDRTFSQYTPGFPAVLAPFVRFGISPYVGVPMLAGCSVTVARLARRFVGPNDPHRAVVGPLAAALLCASTAVINMAGTRYPHLLVATCFMVSLDSTFSLLERHASSRRALLPGIVLGAAVGISLASRPQDGLFLGLGPGVILLASLMRRRVAILPVALAGAVVLLILGATLVVLRVQLGTWFRTGYDLNATIFPWAGLYYSLPPLKLLKWHLPWLVGGATWLPLSAVLAVTGFAATQGRPGPSPASRAVCAALGLSTATILVYYACSELGRGGDMGPSPRYQFFLVGPMAVGAALFAVHVLGSVGRALVKRFVWSVALLAAVAATCVIAPKALSSMRFHNHSRSPGQYAARTQGLHGAIVFAEEGSGRSAPWDWPQNLPIELYEPDNVYAIGGGPNQAKCVRERFPDRPVYRVEHWDAPPVLMPPP